MKQRRYETYTIEKITDDSVDCGGTGFGLFPEMKGKVKAGDVILMETVNFSHITGICLADGGEWFFHKSDADLDREHEEFVAKMKREHEETLAANRDDWQRRTDALPDWIKERITHFQKTGGHNFEVDGWGYELCIAELAVLYLASEGADDDAVMAYSREHGTSGNQHDFAKALADGHRVHHMQMAGTVGGLTPITGDAYYEGKG